MLKLPKPDILTSSPLSSVFWMRSKKASTMSFDSRLLRPRRWNSSSDSSALVRVGVSSVSSSRRLLTGSGGFMSGPSSMSLGGLRLAPEPYAKALMQGGQDLGHDLVD